MVELTHGGTWLKWSSLGRKDRNWALLSFVTAGLAGFPIGILAGGWAYRLGFEMGSGGRKRSTTGVRELLGSDLFANVMLAVAVLSVVSAVAWWRFSRNQDEMFNRIQNYALAQAGCWTFAFVFLWWTLWLGGWVGPLPLTVIVVAGTALLIGFWYYSVRRWL